MPYNITGIENNLPVQPTHILQVIDSLQFGSASIDNTRAGRTNFGAATFTSSAHVEMHNYNGGNSLTVYSDATKLFELTDKVAITGSLGAVSYTHLTLPTKRIV